MTCSHCGTPLTGRTDTFGCHDNPVCVECWLPHPVPNADADCEECDGFGAAKCLQCDGSGTCICFDCDNEHRCGECDGEGRLRDQPCDACKGTGKMAMKPAPFVYGALLEVEA